MNFMRAVSPEGYGHLRFFKQVRNNLGEDIGFRKYFEGELRKLPALYRNIIQKDSGYWWQWLPEGAIEHDPIVYQQKHNLQQNRSASHA
ncbi:hypothetical protein [Pontibacter fetidus]|uniref:Uncharacterized protein n=1 Tax=Pontibacter fetidus TaxID=2700082 RepID=A0A6B2H067_9BACT|nr:hypothetical protein [Pontibacter fetidus]NDK55721.1 hypothetical protein [Pontibacter fetidus]